MTIGVWGDSITYGVGDSEALGWVGRLRKSFDINDYINVYNRGIRGETTEDLLYRFESEVKLLKPEIVIFAIGINDSKYPSRGGESIVPLAEFENNMQLLVDKAKKVTQNILILGPTNVNEGALNPDSDFLFSNEIISQYNTALEAFARDMRLHFMSVFNVLGEADLFDGLHPNANGYEKMFLVVEKVFNDV
jgi:lysophospholipase L1-like esterase